MSDDAFWADNGVASGDSVGKTYNEMFPNNVSRPMMYSGSRKNASYSISPAGRYTSVVRGTAPTHIFASVQKVMSHPPSRFSAVPGALRMRNPAVPYKSTGFAARPSKSLVTGAAALPTRTLTSAAKMPANFCYTANELTEVRDQGQCGSCWAVSSVSMAADRVAVKTRGKVRCALSAVQLMECSNYSGPNVGCDGNDPFTALITMKNKPIKVMQESDYPRRYDARPTNASNCNENDNPNGYAVGATEAFMVTEPIPANAPESQKADIIKRNVENMKQSLYNEGPLVVVFAVPDDFTNYDGLSIYQPPSSFDADSATSWHAVELIGWGTDASTKQEYWICKNSWGSGWPAGHKPGAGKGVFYIGMNKNYCHIEQYAAGIIPVTVNQNKAGKTPDNAYPGEGQSDSSQIGDRMSGMRGVLIVLGLAAVAVGGVYLYKKYRKSGKY
jgi:C1A family cysteine protease